MYGRLGIDVFERNDFVIFKNNVRGYGFTGNFAEQTIFCHDDGPLCFADLIEYVGGKAEDVCAQFCAFATVTGHDVDPFGFKFAEIFA